MTEDEWFEVLIQFVDTPKVQPKIGVGEFINRNSSDAANMEEAEKDQINKTYICKDCMGFAGVVIKATSEEEAMYWLSIELGDDPCNHEGDPCKLERIAEGVTLIRNFN